MHGFGTGDNGTYELSVTCALPPANDSCVNAIMLPCDTTITGTSTAATADPAAGFCGTSVDGPGVWYKFVGNGGDFLVSTCNAANFDTKLSVYTDGCGTLTCVGGNDDNSGAGCTGATSELTVPTVSGQEYLVFVHGFSGATGDFDLTVSGRLSGSYTINDGAPAGNGNFTSFTDAIAAMSCGISGNVTFNVASGSGPYNEQLTINEIDGAGPGATVTFQGEGKDSVMLTYGTAGGNWATVTLDGADYITFKNMTIETAKTTDGACFQLLNSANFNTIDSCNLFMDSVANAPNDLIGVLGSSSFTSDFGEGDNCNNLTVSNNCIIGGEYGVHIEGGTTGNPTVGNSILNNIMRKNYDYGYYADEQDSTTINGNIIREVRNPTGGRGIYQFDCSNTIIEENDVIAPDYGIYLDDENLTAGASRLINNFVISGTDRGLYINDVRDVNIWHNTAVSEGTSATAASACFINISTTDRVDIRNNIFVGNAGFAFEYDETNATTNTLALDNNLYFTNGTVLAQFGGTATNYATLADWITAEPTFNAASAEGNPLFASPTDLHVTGPLANNAGDNSLGITVDIDGDTRPFPGDGGTVDIGADEFRINPDDLAVTALLSPEEGCGDANTQVILAITNVGSAAQPSVPITVDIGGAGSGTLTLTSTDTINSGETDTIIVGTVNTSAGGTFTFTAYTTLGSDADQSNDTIVISVALDALPTAPVALNDSACTGDTVVLRATGGTGNYAWYTDLVGGSPISTADTLEFGPVFGKDTLYVTTFGTASESVPTPTAGTGSFISQDLGWGLGFTVTQDITLDDVTVYPTAGTGTMEIILLDQTTNTELARTTPQAVSGPGANVVNVGFNIAPGTYKLGMASTGITSLIRESGIGGFPYTSPSGAVSITGGSTGTGTPTSTSYYWFYNWNITAAGCPSPRTAVCVSDTCGGILAAVTPTDTSICQGESVTLMASGGTLYNWNTGETTASITVTPATSTTYMVTVSNGTDSAVVMSNVTVNTPLAGTFTIDDGQPTAGTNFASFGDAVARMQQCGIGGNVVFNVVTGSGPYDEQVVIPYVPGAGASAQVTFQGEGKDSVTLTYSGAATNGNGTVILDSAQYVSFKNMTIATDRTSEGFAIHLLNAANQITIDSCNVLSDSTTVSPIDVSCIVASESLFNDIDAGFNCNNLTVTNSCLIGGEYGMNIEGNEGATPFMTGFVIENNIFRKQYDRAFTGDNIDSVFFRNNVVREIRDATNGDGIWVNDIGLFLFNGNDVQAPDWGVYLEDGNQPGITTNLTGRNTVINNFVLSQNDYGLYFSDVRGGTDVFHNTCVTNGTSTAATALRVDVSTSIDFDIRNNIAIANNGFAFEYDETNAATNLTALDYNVYNSNGTNLAQFGGTTNYIDLAAWQTAFGAFNANALEGDPGFVSPTDLHVLGPLANNVGDNSVGVNIDIDGDTRPFPGDGGTVDIGADEFIIAGDDLGLVAILSPVDQCATDMATVQVVVNNFGTNAQSNYTVTAEINPGGIVLDSVASGPLASGATDTITLGTFDALAGGTFNITAYTTITGDSDNSNDTTTASVLFEALPAAPVAVNDTGCTGDTLTLVASGASSYTWYDAAAGGNVVSTDSFLVINGVAGKDSFYVETSLSATERVGQPAFNGTSGFETFTGYGLFFTVNDAVTIDSVYMYPFTGTADIAVQILDPVTDAVLQQGPTINWTGAAGGLRTPVPVGISLQPGNYKMSFTSNNTTQDVGREFSQPYPYTSPSGAVTITAGAIGGASSNTTYYWFYDWALTVSGCSSPRTLVCAVDTCNFLCTDPTATFATACDPAEQDSFFVDITVTDPGSGPTLTATSDADGRTFSVATTGVTRVGPFLNNTTVEVTLAADTLGGVCNISQAGLTDDCIIPPVNDSCQNAIAIACGDTVTGSTVAATVDADAIAAGFCGTTPQAPGVWYSVQGTGFNIVASLCGSNFDTKLNVYTDGCGTLTCVGGNDDDCGTQSIVTFASVLGQEYLILVNGFGSNVGDYELIIDCPLPPANDSCVNAELLVQSVNCNAIPGTSIGATQSLAGCTGTANDDVWYAFVATNTTATIDVQGAANFDGVLELFDACGGTSISACTDATTGGGLETINATGLTIGNTYYFRTYDWFGTAGGDFTVCVYGGLPSCSNPVATAVTACDPATVLDSFFVDVSVTDLGGGPNLTISNSVNASTTAVAATGTFRIGPFVNGASVDVTVANDTATGGTCQTLIAGLSDSCVTPTCINPTVAYNVFCDSLDENNFQVEVIVSDIGTGPALTLSNSANANTTAITAPGTFNLGPYPNGTTVTVFVTNDAEPTCRDTADVTNVNIVFDAGADTSICDGESIQIGPTNVPVQSENFDACAQPAGWTTNIVNGAADWTFGPGGVNSGGSTLNSFDGSCFAYFDDDDLGAGALASTVQLLSPALDVSSFSGLTLDVDVHYRNITGGASFSIDVWDGSGWVNLRTYTGSVPGGSTTFANFQSENIDLSSYIAGNTNLQVRFVYFDNAGWDWWAGIDNFTLSAPPVASFSWTPATGLNNPNLANPTASPSSTTTYIGQVANANGCYSRDTVTITVNPTPVVVADPVAGSPFCFGDTSDVLLTGTPAGGTFTGTGVVAGSFFPDFAGAGTFEIVYEYTDTTTGCSATDTIVADVLQPLVPTLNLAGSVCSNDLPITLSGTPAGGTFSGPGVSGNVFDPSTVGAPTADITYVVTDTNNCTDSVTVTVNVVDVQPSFTGLPATVCEEDADVTLSGTPGSGVFSGPGISGSTFSPGGAGPGTHDVIFTVDTLIGYSVDPNCTFAPASNGSPNTHVWNATGFTDDATSPSLPLGFTFNFFGINYTEVYASTNGFHQLRCSKSSNRLLK